MASHRVELTAEAREQLNALPSTDRQKLVERLRALERDPAPPDSRLLPGESDGRCLALGFWRVLYRVMKVRVLVLVIKQEWRRELYRRRSG